MPGYEDIRFLTLTLDGMQKRLSKLEDGLLPFATQQKGPLPGWLRAATIEAATINAAVLQGPQPSTGAFMRLDLSGALAGSRPLLVVNDGVVNRVEVGNLAANGVSPAMYGMRVNDAGGNPIFDSLGLIKVASLIASSQSQSYISATLSGPGSGTGISGTGGEVTITSTGNFTLTRTANVLLIGTCAAAGWTTAGIVPLIAPIYIRVPGQANSASGTVHHSGVAGTTTDPTSATPVQVLNLVAGTYSASLLWNSVSANERLDVYAYNLFVFLLGS